MTKIKCYIVSIVLTFLSAVSAFSEERADSTLMQYLRGEGLPSYSADDVTLYTNGHDKFEALIKDIDNAKRRVWIEYFIFANDSIGTLVMDHLVQAAKRGCDVRVVTDYYKDRERHYGMSRPEYADSLAKFGVDFQMFDRYKVLWFNHVCRDHRKIVNIDDSIGYIGGLNIADYYINGKPSFGGWRDTHARVTGPAVEGLAKLFHNQYSASGGQKEYTYHMDPPQPSLVGREQLPSHAGDTTTSIEGGISLPTREDRGRSASIVYFERVHNGGYKKQAETRNAIIAALDAAKDTIRLVSPYLLPTHTVRQAIIRALDRGVHMEVLFSKVGDSPMLSYGNYHFAKRLLKHGAHIYLYKGKFHHSKIMMIDGQVSMVGSANLNSRSLKYDYEASSFIFSKELTQELNQVFEEDKLQSDIFSIPYYKENFSYGFRCKGWWIDRFLTPVL